MTVRIKRARDAPSVSDGTRILVDRYWPRGLDRNEFGTDLWLPEIAPSPSLIAWYAHKAERWEEFKRRYRDELSSDCREGLLEDLRRRSSVGTVTLIFGSRDIERNGARVLAEILAGTSEVERVSTVVRLSAEHQRPASRWRVPDVTTALAWSWVVLALSVPMAFFVALYVLVGFGAAGPPVVGVAAAGMLGATIVHSVRVDRRTQLGRVKPPREDAEPWWAGFKDLLAAISGTAIGVGVTAALALGAIHLH